MTVLEQTENVHIRPQQSTLPTLDEARFEAEVRKADNWIDAMVSASVVTPRAEMVQLTPALAKALLARNVSNRNLRKPGVEKYCRDIANGGFHFNGASIVVSLEGNLLDGQHRSEAVLHTGVAIPAVIVFGVEDIARTTMDQGIVRKAGDYLAMLGHKNSTSLAVAGGFLWQYLKFGRIDQRKQPPTKSETLRTVEDHPNLEKSLLIVGDRRARLLGGAAMLGFCHYIIAMKSGDRAAVEQFFLSLMSGEGLYDGDPILYARNRLIAERTNRRRAEDRIEIILKAWNAHRTGAKVRAFGITGNLPKVER